MYLHSVQDRSSGPATTRAAAAAASVALTTSLVMITSCGRVRDCPLFIILTVLLETVAEAETTTTSTTTGTFAKSY